MVRTHQIVCVPEPAKIGEDLIAIIQTLIIMFAVRRIAIAMDIPSMESVSNLFQIAEEWRNRRIYKLNISFVTNLK